MLFVYPARYRTARDLRGDRIYTIMRDPILERILLNPVNPVWFAYFVRSAAVGGPSTQLTSQALSTVMNVNELAGNHAS